MDLTTPVRDSATPSTDGYVLLHDHNSSYADGGEARVLEIVRGASDISSTSDELLSHATDWPTRYHLDPARANIMKTIDLPADGRVLEVGAGCGAVTRYIAERVALVDALEPVPSRARVISERTRDLGNTQVFVGHLGDVPDAPAYDVIVVIGVLEYVANGSDDEQPYLDFLDEVRTRLVPGGTLVLAIENQFGVKYLAGAPEDHSNRVADSMESYPYGSPARTFSRSGLLSLMTRAGLTPVDRIALPDYKMTEAVIDPARVPGDLRSILTQVSEFPSPDWVASVGRFADESLFWGTLIDAGLAAETGNSFLIIASNGEGPSVWRDDLVGAYWPVGIAAEHTHATQLLVGAGGLELKRLDNGHTPSSAPGLRAHVSSHLFAGEPTFVTRARRADAAELARLIAAWTTLIDERDAAGGPVEWDLVPHRLLVADDGTVQPSITEWHLTGRDWDVVRRRGIVHLADRLARTSRADRWPTAPTTRALATELGARAGLPDDGTWIETFVDDEAALLTEVGQPSLEHSTEHRRDVLREQLVQLLDRPTGPERLLGDRLLDTQAELAAVRAELAASNADRARLRKWVAKLKKRLAAANAAATPAPRSLRSRAPGWVKDVARPVRKAVRGR